MKVKTVVPKHNSNQVAKVMKKVFEQYDFCKRTPGDSEREEYVRKVKAAVSSLGGDERNLVTQRYMIDFYRLDYQVYNFHFNPSISKDTYTKIRERAFLKLFVLLSENGLIQN
ncbi:hypothetical protein [Paenibacillus sp. FSL R7-0026]|uniref:hypothetical protein n=1 Tax=Paenibacillus sp. FSL R7-0026 TaxID=2921668 RepID=UPI0030F9C0CC